MTPELRAKAYKAEKRLYFEEVDKLCRDAIAQMNFYDAEYAELDSEIKSGKYSYSAKQELREKQAHNREMRKLAHDSALEKVGNLSQKMRDTILAEDRIRGEDITPDAALLSVGVALSASDLEAMFDRNAGNSTMEQLVCKYADEHNVKIARIHEIRDKAQYEAAGNMRQMASLLLHWPDQPNYYEEFMGENSDRRAAFVGVTD